MSPPSPLEWSALLCYVNYYIITIIIILKCEELYPVSRHRERERETDILPRWVSRDLYNVPCISVKKVTHCNAYTLDSHLILILKLYFCNSSHLDIFYLFDDDDDEEFFFPGWSSAVFFIYRFFEHAMWGKTLLFFCLMGR